MNKKRFLFAALAYVVIVMVIATVWHLGLFKNVYAAARMREHPLFHLGISSMLIQAVIVAYSYPLLNLRGAPLAKGLKFGLTLGLLLGSYWSPRRGGEVRRRPGACIPDLRGRILSPSVRHRGHRRRADLRAAGTPRINRRRLGGHCRARTVNRRLSETASC